MIRTILWDLDGTLLNFKKSESIAIRKTLMSAGIKPTPKTIQLYSQINDVCWKQLERKEITREQLYTLRFERLFDQLGVSADVEATAALYPRFLGQAAYFIPGSYELCASLSGKYRQYIVTNGNTYTSCNRIRLAGFDCLMDDYFVSEEIGVNKPDPRFFELCFARIPGGICREETVIVGDSLSSDMQGGRNAGLRCVWYNPTGEQAPDPSLFDRSVSALSELPQIFETL